MNARVQLVGVCAATVLLTRITAAQPADTTNALHRAVSASRQFTAFAPSPLWAPALCVFAERVKREWLAQLDSTDTWRDPIVFVVHRRDAGQSNAPSLTLRTYQTDIGLKYQIDCLVPPPLDEPALLTSIVEALCAETANRGQPVANNTGYVAVPVPRWLVAGLAQPMQDHANIWLGVVRRSAGAGRPLTARSLLGATQEPEDEPELELFRAKAWLFTEGLLSLPGGAEKMQRFLSEIGASKSASNAFWTVYAGDFPQPVTLEKWWYVRLAERIRSDVAQNLTTGETLRQLDAALPTQLKRDDPAQTEQEVALRALPEFRKETWFLPVLATKLRVLEVLRNQALPRDRKIIDRYAEAIRALQKKKLDDFARAMDCADAARRDAERDARAINDYVDGAERIYAPQDLAGLFTGYFRTLDEQRDIEHQRRSPISDYLDTFDR